MESGCVLTDGTALHVFPSRNSIEDILHTKVNATDRGDQEDPFYIVNLGRLAHLYNQWSDLLPSVIPFYAVKCNYDPVILQTLAALGAGFDCASKQEITTILNLGVDPSRIIYANPCKQKSHIRFAAEVGVDVMTFDNEVELYKIKNCFPTAKLVIRIMANDPTATVKLGTKFGVESGHAPHLLSVAKSFGLDVVGVSFHVGSGAQSSSAYANALALAKEVFVNAEKLGFTMKLLDIGGGFPGATGTESFFQEIASTVMSSLEATFGSQYKDLKVIGEPGRYFACSTHVLAVSVISKRCISSHPNKEFMYYINDGIYGSFNCLLHGHVKPTPKILQCSTNSVATSSIVWGPTCDSIDKVNTAFLLPELNVGDWLYYEDMGAYTICAQSPFNGFSRPMAYYYCTDKESNMLRSLLGSSSTEELITQSSLSCQQLVQEHVNTNCLKMEVDCC
ncbi:ornithine decarboxylase-like [Dysidea avara]|uniref:ornithine decarboxylase-like n=1 Tax=Dysidea avara TaxID=196820 RepID=UPI00332093FD